MFVANDDSMMFKVLGDVNGSLCEVKMMNLMVVNWDLPNFDCALCIE